MIDTYEDKVGSYLVKICESNLGASESREAAKFLHIISDMERISDHALNIQASAEEIYDKKISFSESAELELNTIVEALREMVDVTFTSFVNEDTTLALEAEPLEEVIDELKEFILAKHVDRVQSGDCSIQNGFVLNDLLTNMERVSDHCSNITTCTLRANKDFEFHDYLSKVKNKENQFFTDKLKIYEEKYLKRF